MITLLAVLLQASVPTVGDTIWLERRVATPPGAELRAPSWTPEGTIGLLGRPIIRQAGETTVIAWPAVAWTAGRHVVNLPGPVLIQADGTTDSLPVETRTIVVASVLPDGTPPDRIPPQPEVGIVVERITTPYPVVVALLIATAFFLPLAWWWRRRGPAMPPVVPPAAVAAFPLAEWAEAGEARAVAAVAGRALRNAITRQLPGAAPGLVTSRLIKVMTDQRPGWPVAEIGDLLRALEAVQYAAGSNTEVVALAARAEELRQQVDHMASGAGKVA